MDNLRAIGPKDDYDLNISFKKRRKYIYSFPITDTITNPPISITKSKDSLEDSLTINNHLSLALPKLPITQYTIDPEPKRPKKQLQIKNKPTLSIKYLTLYQEINRELDKSKDLYYYEQQNETEEDDTEKIHKKICEDLNKENNYNNILEQLHYLDNIPNSLMNKVADRIIDDLNSNNNNKKITIYANPVIHNVYFQFILDRVIHKIELRNQLNQIISQENVINMLHNEIERFQCVVYNIISPLGRTKRFHLRKDNHSNYKIDSIPSSDDREQSLQTEIASEQVYDKCKYIYNSSKKKYAKRKIGNHSGIYVPSASSYSKIKDSSSIFKERQTDVSQMTASERDISHIGKSIGSISDKDNYNKIIEYIPEQTQEYFENTKYTKDTKESYMQNGKDSVHKPFYESQLTKSETRYRTIEQQRVTYPNINRHFGSQNVQKGFNQKYKIVQSESNWKVSQTKQKESMYDKFNVGKTESRYVQTNETHKRGFSDVESTSLPEIMQPLNKSKDVMYVNSLSNKQYYVAEEKKKGGSNQIVYYNNNNNVKESGEKKMKENNNNTANYNTINEKNVSEVKEMKDNGDVFNKEIINENDNEEEVIDNVKEFLENDKNDILVEPNSDNKESNNEQEENDDDNEEEEQEEVEEEEEEEDEEDEDKVKEGKNTLNEFYKKTRKNKPHKPKKNKRNKSKSKKPKINKHNPTQETQITNIHTQIQSPQETQEIITHLKTEEKEKKQEIKTTQPTQTSQKNKSQTKDEKRTNSQKKKEERSKSRKPTKNASTSKTKTKTKKKKLKQKSPKNPPAIEETPNIHPIEIKNSKKEEPKLEPKNEPQIPSPIKEENTINKDTLKLLEEEQKQSAEKLAYIKQMKENEEKERLRKLEELRQETEIEENKKKVREYIEQMKKNELTNNTQQSKKKSPEQNDILTRLLLRDNPNFIQEYEHNKQEPDDNSIQNQSSKNVNEQQPNKEEENKQTKIKTKDKTSLKKQNPNLAFDSSYLFKKETKKDYSEAIKQSLLDSQKQMEEVQQEKEQPPPEEEKIPREKIFFRRKPREKSVKFFQPQKFTKKFVHKKFDYFQDPINKILNEHHEPQKQEEPEEEEEEEDPKKSLEEMMKEFVDKIKQLKNVNSEDFAKEMEKFIDSQIEASDYNAIRKKEFRINEFMKKLSIYRTQKEGNRISKLNKLSFKHPFDFFYPNENNFEHLYKDNLD